MPCPNRAQEPPGRQGEVHHDALLVGADLDLPAMRMWRERYEDREVDFADQTLVWLGDERRTNLIATTDFDDFEAYRLPNGKPFKILIARP